MARDPLIFQKPRDDLRIVLKAGHLLNLINDILDMFRPHAEEKGISLVLDYSSALDPEIA